MARGRVLIVDDEYIIVMNLKLELERTGYDVCGMASEGEEAIKTAKSTDPDLILIDINLIGEMDGIEVARHIKEFSSPSIIFITGYQDASLKKRAMALKPAAYLIKPVNVKEIHEIYTSTVT